MSKNTQTSGLVNYIAHSGSIVSVSGSLTVTGSLNVTGGMTGSFQGVATTASYVLNAVSASFATTASYAVSASVATNAVTASYVLNAVSASFATTAVTSSFANAFTVAGTLTATTLVVQTITSSVDFVTGSTRFGSLLANTHAFTGSVGMTGSLSVIGGNVGIGTASPGSFVEISKSSNSGGGGTFPRLAIKNTLATQGDGSSTFNFADILISSGNEAVNMFLSSTYAAGTWAPAGIINVATNHGLQFKTNNTLALTIASTGAATFASSVTAGDIILGNSNILSWGGAYGANIPSIVGVNGASGYLAIYPAGSTGGEKFRITNGGNVGIGTTSPTNLITLQKLGSVSTTPGIDFRGTLSLGGAYNSLDYNSGRIYAVFDADSYASARVTIAYPTGAGTFADGLSVKNGNVGIGTTSPAANDGTSKTLQVGARLAIQNVIGTQFLIGTNLYYDNVSWKYIAAAKAQAVRGTGESGTIQFSLSPTGTAGGTITNNDSTDIKMVILESGNVGIGTISPTEKLHIYGGGSGPEFRMEGAGHSWYIRAYNDNYNVLTPSGRQAVSYLNNGDVRNYNNTTTWQQTSDVRVKENINVIPNAISKILALNPVIFDYKQEFADKNNWDDNKKINNVGFIAQEFETIFPKYISTNKYEMTETIIDDLKSIDTGHLVPYLVKAIQELSAKITQLENK
jgi:hypothetical protein